MARKFGIRQSAIDVWFEKDSVIKMDKFAALDVSNFKGALGIVFDAIFMSA